MKIKVKSIRRFTSISTNFVLSHNRDVRGILGYHTEYRPTILPPTGTRKILLNKKKRKGKILRRLKCWRNYSANLDVGSYGRSRSCPQGVASWKGHSSQAVGNRPYRISMPRPFRYPYRHWMRKASTLIWPTSLKIRMSANQGVVTAASTKKIKETRTLKTRWRSNVCFDRLYFIYLTI